MNLRRLTGVGAGLLLLVSAGAACSDEDSVFEVEVGQCVETLSDLSGSISELPDVDCEDEHEGEVMFLVEHEGDDDDFPGQSELQEEAAAECEGDEFEDYTGTTFAESAIRVFYITPSEESWGEGDRETICVASTGQPVDESFEDNGDDFLLSEADSDVDFDQLIADCQGGDNAACDQLYFATPVGSPEEEIGATCGGRSDELLNGSCEDELG